jgi:hypothetical protein
MSVWQSRFHAFWASYEMRATIWRRLCLVAASLLALSMVISARALARARTREVIRIGCDGIPAVVTLAEPEYSDPNDRELQAFARRFAVQYARADSWSIANDASDCAHYMRPELRVKYQEEMRGSRTRPGLISIVQSLKRRTQIDPMALKVDVDKKVYPWVVKVEGTRQAVGKGTEGSQPFSMEVDLVRADRSEVLEGLLVWDVRSVGGPVPRGIPTAKGE